MVLVWGWFCWFALAICTNVQSPVKKLFSDTLVIHALVKD